MLQMDYFPSSVWSRKESQRTSFSADPSVSARGAAQSADADLANYMQTTCVIETVSCDQFKSASVCGEGERNSELLELILLDPLAH